MSNTGDERGIGTTPPGWWLELFDKAHDERDEGTVWLGQRLAELVGRGRAWDHSAVSNFINHKRFTTEMAEAFSLHYNIPRFEKYIRAESIEAAHELEMFLRKVSPAGLRVARVDREAAALLADAERQRAGKPAPTRRTPERSRPRR